MTTVIVTALDAERKRSARRRKLRYSRVRTSDGKTEAVYHLDFGGADFASDFSKVFQSAVNKARKENRKLLGMPDVEPKRR